MKRYLKYSKFTGIAAAILAIGSVRPVSAAVLNLTNETIAGIPQSLITAGATTFTGGLINGALYRRPLDADESNSGSGIFRDLYRVDSNSGAESGYNRDGVMDSDVPMGFDPVITIGDLVLDSTGTAYVFVVDTNEPGSSVAQYISLDNFRIYIGGTADPVSLPQNLGELGTAFGAPVYDMSPVGQVNHVLMDYSLFSGSGTMDVFVFVPKALFGGLEADQQVYVYSEFGAYTGAPGFDPAAGPEQVSIPGKAIEGTVDPLLSAVPEPGTGVLLLAAALVSLCRRR